jgi:hypothetical protein
MIEIEAECEYEYEPEVVWRVRGDGSSWCEWLSSRLSLVTQWVTKHEWSWLNDWMVGKCLSECEFLSIFWAGWYSKVAW